MKEPIIFGVHKKEDIEPTGSINPMVDKFGRGPFRTCRGCVHLIDGGSFKSTVECEIKSECKEMKKKHSMFWPACAKFEPKPAEANGNL